MGPRAVAVPSLPADPTAEDEVAPREPGDIREHVSTDSKIRLLSAEIVSGSSDRMSAVTAICEWLSKNIELDKRSVFPDASLALRDRRADCEGRAALFTALAQAAGIRARTLYGLFYCDAPEPCMRFHAWNEVYLSEEFRWFPIDPTFLRIPTDEKYVLLTDGGPESAERLGPFFTRTSVAFRQESAKIGPGAGGDQ